MDIHFERDLSHNYLVPDVLGEYAEDNYQIHMLTENQISGLLTCSVHHMNGKIAFYYDVTSRQSMKQIFEKDYLNEADILKIIKAIYSTLIEIGKYLLDENGILLDPKCIYMDVETKEPGFCYLPGNKEAITESMRILSEYILHHLEQNDQRAVMLGYELFRQTTQETYNLENVLKKAFEMPTQNVEQKKADLPMHRTIIEEEINQGESSEESKKEDKIKNEAKRIRIEKSKKERDKSKKELLPALVIGSILFCILLVLMKLDILTVTQGGGIAFLIIGIFGFILSEQKKESKTKELIPENKKEKSENVDSPPDGATTLLWEGEEEYEEKLSLISMNARDRVSVVLVKDSYLIGKMKTKVDVLVNDSAVSRVHAKIVKEGNDYYLSDMNSTNGTFVNGRRLEANEKVKLNVTDEISFAESGFYVGKC